MLTYFDFVVFSQCIAHCGIIAMTESFKCAAISSLAITIDGSSVGQLPEDLGLEVSASEQNEISFRSIQKGKQTPNEQLLFNW